MKSISENRDSDNLNRVSPGFHLTKWFLDGVNEAGWCMIGYAAKMCWNGITVPYNSLLISQPGKDVVYKSRFRQLSWPVCNGEMIRWDDKGFGISGQWNQTGSELRIRLFESEDGYLDWCCFQTRSNATIKINDEHKIVGNGYAEQLILTIEPWRIRMDQLRWGRFHSDADNLVWIDFQGKVSNRWVWYNGKLITVSHLNDKNLVIPELEIKLSLEDSRLLEKGRKINSVVKSLLSLLPGFNKTIPGFFLKARETKWICRGTLVQSGVVKSEGWAIRELVDFKKGQA